MCVCVCVCMSEYLCHRVCAVSTQTRCLLLGQLLYPQSDVGSNDGSGIVKALVRRHQQKTGSSQVCSEHFNITTML